MVNYWLVLEMFGNNDAVKKSRYAYKDQGQKLVFGPVWDFDWGVGSLRVCARDKDVSTVSAGWKCQDALEKEAYSFFKDWADSPEFCTRLHTRYWQVRDRFDACIADGSRTFSAAIPSAALTAAPGEPNCVSFIAYNSSGNVVARNYALVTQSPSEATSIILR